MASPAQAAPAHAAMLDIPDRADGDVRPVAPAGFGAAQIGAPGRRVEAAEGANAKAAAINAHIAAARRAANTAAAETERREDLDWPAGPRSGTRAGWRSAR